MSANGGNDLTALVRMSPSELERSIASQKEEIDLEYAKTGNLEKRSEALKALAVKQNVYWSELAKTLVKGTKEYDSYIKNANDGFREYKSSVKDSIEVQKENRLETSKLTQQIESLTSENKTLQSQVTQANNTVNKDIENLTAKFKSSTGEWITDINKARTALQGLSVDSQAAIASLNKIQSNNTSASQNVSGLTSAGLGTPKTPEALATFKDALPNGLLGINAETHELYTKFLANRRLEAIGLPALYPGAKNPYTWIAETQDSIAMTNFFEGTVRDYQSASVLEDDF